jgi:fatty-acyl-CoA synthase
LVDTFGVCQADTIMPVAPMFHANAWGLPFAAPMLGSRLVLPGPHLDPESLLDLLAGERVTMACGVPTIWLAVAEALEKDPARWTFATPVRLTCGGGGPPEGLIRRLDRFGLYIKHLWGMTETTPLGIAGGLRPHMQKWPEEKQYEARCKQGMPVPFVEIRLIGPNGEVPFDGIASGEIEIRGPWVAASYYDAPDQADHWTADGWFRTGDVATMDDHGYVKIVDRVKDLVKSGGEWISSVDLENALMGYPAVKEACVVGIPHPKWQERPLAAIVLKEGAHATADELRAYLSQGFSKWQLPDAFVFVDAIPRTSVGKFKKNELRSQFSDWTWT